MGPDSVPGWHRGVGLPGWQSDDIRRNILKTRLLLNESMDFREMFHVTRVPDHCAFMSNTEIEDQFHFDASHNLQPMESPIQHSNSQESIRAPNSPVVDAMRDMR